jgi:hypothetical protein
MELEKWEAAHRDRLDDLMRHFAHVGNPYESVDALMADMLDDVLDVWEDDHYSGNDSCKEVE